MKTQTCCFTGHRELKDEEEEIKENLRETVRELAENHIFRYISGGARGFDLLAAETVLELRKELPHIHLILILPCRNQTRGWEAKERNRYEEVTRQADEVCMISDFYYRGCMHKRNRRMVEESAVCCFENQSA